MLIYRWLLVVVFLWTGLAGGFCQTQQELNVQAYNRFVKADQKLNQTYRAVLQQYRQDTVFVRNLRNAQRIWVQLRDADLLARHPDYGPDHNGSIYPMCVNNELTLLTEERTKRLRMWQTGAPKFDACSGSVDWSVNIKKGR